MALILVVEDDSSIANLIALYLRNADHTVAIETDGAAALTRLQQSDFEPALVVLDLMLPGLDGRGVARRIRAESSLPILMLTALDDARDKLEGFELGADDYLTKPFNPNELVARVAAILRRSQPAIPIDQAISNRTMTLGTCTIDSATRRVTVAGRELELRTKEFDLLAVLAMNVGIVLSREQLLATVWAAEYAGDTRTVDVHVSRLRDRLTQSGAELTIETVRSVGYRLTRG